MPENAKPVEPEPKQNPTSEELDQDQADKVSGGAIDSYLFFPPPPPHH